MVEGKQAEPARGREREGEGLLTIQVSSRPWWAPQEGVVGPLVGGVVAPGLRSREGSS